MCKLKSGQGGECVLGSNEDLIGHKIIFFQACDTRNNTPLVAAMKNGHVEVCHVILLYFQFNVILYI